MCWQEAKGFDILDLFRISSTYIEYELWLETTACNYKLRDKQKPLNHWLA
jgi:hypothetical protein